MDTTPKTAAGIFDAQLSALGLLFGMELQGATPGERLSSIGKQAKESANLRQSLQDFFENPIHFAAKFASADGGIFEAVTKTLLATAVRGAIHDYGSLGAPKKQHWMPYSYLAPFGRPTGEGKHNRSVMIPGVSFADGLVMSFETRDSSFMHEKIKGSGFYEDGAEFFFHLVENLYSQGKIRREREIDHSLVALFFFAQSVRNPRYGERFVHSRLSSIVDAILANMDAVGPKMETRFLGASAPLPFTPYVPPFVDRFGSARVYSLPLEPKLLFSISSGELDELSWKQVPNRYRDSVIRQAYSRKSHVFGIPKGGVLGILHKISKEH